MKYLIIFNHPYEKSYCSAILNAAADGIAAAGNSVDIINLDKDKFDPVITAEYLDKYRRESIDDPAIMDYQERINNADSLVFICPIWWEAMPALMKGWIDKVITKGFAYDVDKSGAFPKFYPLISHIKEITLITTMDSPGIVYRLIFGNAVKKIFINGTFRKIGVKNVRWISFDRVNSISNQKRRDRLESIRKYFKKRKQI